jgi:hypothetical protein
MNWNAYVMGHRNDAAWTQYVKHYLQPSGSLCILDIQHYTSFKTDLQITSWTLLLLDMNVNMWLVNNIELRTGQV